MMSWVEELLPLDAVIRSKLLPVQVWLQLAVVVPPPFEPKTAVSKAIAKR